MCSCVLVLIIYNQYNCFSVCFIFGNFILFDSNSNYLFKNKLTAPMTEKFSALNLSKKKKKKRRRIIIKQSNNLTNQQINRETKKNTNQKQQPKHNKHCPLLLETKKNKLRF